MVGQAVEVRAVDLPIGVTIRRHPMVGGRCKQDNCHTEHADARRNRNPEPRHIPRISLHIHYRLDVGVDTTLWHTKRNPKEQQQ